MPFDKFEPLKSLSLCKFSFVPERYEMWIGGRNLKSGKISCNIEGTTDESTLDKFVIMFDSKDLLEELERKSCYDVFLTQHDRLMLLTLPSSTNVPNNGISVCKSVIGPTRQHKHFERNQPYGCNLFFSNRILTKVTFSYSNPEKLLEFYSTSCNE